MSMHHASGTNAAILSRQNTGLQQTKPDMGMDKIVTVQCGAKSKFKREKVSSYQRLSGSCTSLSTTWGNLPRWVNLLQHQKHEQLWRETASGCKLVSGSN